MNTEKLVNYCLGVILIGLVAICVTQTLYTAKLKTELATVKQARADEQNAAARLQAATEAKHRATEQTLQAQANDSQKATHEAVQSIAAQRDALSERLRLALASAAKARGTPTVASIGEARPVDHGAELPATLGAEDVAEASRAETIRVNLLGCYRQYDEAAEALRALK